VTLRLPRELGARLETWSRQAAPREGCGLLLGRRRGRTTAVERVTWARNLEPRHDRFDLDPLGLLTAERAARGAGLEVVGVWHSHPSGCARPSATDRAGAYEGWSYVIVGLAGSTPELRAFRLAGGRFAEQACSSTTSAPGSPPGSPASRSC
jgi:proteasome lid subunit RPN8/RPN11